MAEKTINTDLRIIPHGREFEGVVISARAQKTVTVEWERRKFVSKFERYMKARTRVKAHNPESIDAKEGDIVRIKECRPISKTKNFIIISKIGHDEFALDKAKRLREDLPAIKPGKDENKEAKE